MGISTVANKGKFDESTVRASWSEISPPKTFRIMDLGAEYAEKPLGHKKLRLTWKGADFQWKGLFMFNIFMQGS